MIQAVIFDMDGTLLDTEAIGLESWARIALEGDTEVPRSLVEQFVGLQYDDVIACLAPHVGGVDEAVRLYGLSRVYRDEICKTGLRSKPFARECLEELKSAGYHLALATSSKREVAVRELTQVGLIDYMESITSGGEAEHGKPAPDIYLKAAARLGVEPEACAVAEDSRNGVRAGAAAGMHVFMIPDLVPADDELRALATDVLNDLGELPSAIRDLEERLS